MAITMKLPTTNLYAALGVQRDATPDAIKKAFRQLSLEHHPDKAGNSAEAHDRYVGIVEAYSVLKDAEKKRSYDARMGSYEFLAMCNNWRRQQEQQYQQQQQQQQQSAAPQATKEKTPKEKSHKKKKSSSHHKKERKNSSTPATPATPFKREGSVSAFDALAAALRKEFDAWKSHHQDAEKKSEEKDKDTNSANVDTVPTPPQPPTPTPSSTTQDHKEGENHHHHHQQHSPDEKAQQEHAHKTDFASLGAMHRTLQEQLDTLADEPEATRDALQFVGQRLNRCGIPMQGSRDELGRWFNRKAMPRLRQLGREAEDLALALARTRASAAASMSRNDNGDGEEEAGALSPETIHALYQGLAHSVERLRARLDDAWRAIERIGVLTDQMALFGRDEVDAKETLAGNVCIAINDWLTGKRDP